MVSEEQTIHLGKFLTLVNKLQNKYSKDIRYSLKSYPISENIYEDIECPPDAVKMHETKSKIMTEELRKQK